MQKQQNQDPLCILAVCSGPYQATASNAFYKCVGIYYVHCKKAPFVQTQLIYLIIYGKCPKIPNTLF